MDELIATHHMRDADGRVYLVEEIQEFVGNPAERIKGLKRLQLPDGTKVNFIDPDTFEIVITGTILRR